MLFVCQVRTARTAAQLSRAFWFATILPLQTENVPIRKSGKSLWKRERVWKEKDIKMNRFFFINIVYKQTKRNRNVSEGPKKPLIVNSALNVSWASNFYLYKILFVFLCIYIYKILWFQSDLWHSSTCFRSCIECDVSYFISIIFKCFL